MRRQPLTRSNNRVHYFSRNRLSRGRGLRKTTGCLTCRRRHVKCDEVKPRCTACVRIQRECRWPSLCAHDDDDDQQSQQPPEVSHSSIASPTVEPEPDSAPDSHSATDGNLRDSSSTPSGPTATDLHPVGNDATCSVQATDEGRTALVEVTDSWQDLSTTSIAQSSSETPEPDPARHGGPQAPTSPSPGIEPGRSGIGRTSPGLSAMQVLGDSPGLSSLASNTYDWTRTDAGAFRDFNIDDGTQVWANLLLKDASSWTGGGADIGLPLRGVSNAGHVIEPTQLPSSQPLSSRQTNLTALSGSPSSPLFTSSSSSIGLSEQAQRQGYEPWQSRTRLELQPNEYPLFHDFIQNLSLWMDFFDPKRPFGTLVPHLAMRNRGLLNAILALSIRHLSLNVRFQPQDSDPQDPLDALPFYFTTLNYIREAMQYESYRNSLELLATASIVSAYEMLDGSRQDWERHLRGLSFIQHSQGIHGDSGGLKQTVWWAWLCQDVWAAWREGRKPFTSWRPDRQLSQLDSFELAARSVHLFGQAVGFCSRDEVELGCQDPMTRLAKGERLQQALADWLRHLSVDFDPLPLMMQRDTEDGPFKPIWIHPPCFAIAVQLFHCSHILIKTNSPCLRGMNEYRKQRSELDEHIAVICGIGICLKSDPASVMCSQALFIAGLFMHDQGQRELVLDLLEGCWRRAGWPTRSLGVDLEREWSASQ